MSMQPIHNLADVAEWSGSEAKPTVAITVTDPDGDNLTAIDIKVYSTIGQDPDVDTPDYSIGLTGTWSSGEEVEHDLDYAIGNDTTVYIHARVKDSHGEWSGWHEEGIKVRWSQAIYEYNVGAGAAQYAFNPGTISGSSPSSAFLFRSATGAGGVGAGPWVENIDEAEGGSWVQVLVRLAIGRDTTTATSLTHMGITYLGEAQQPDKWAYEGDDTDAWTLSEAQRRYGTKSLKYQRTENVMTYAEAITDLGGNHFIVPVVAGTEYTISVWVQGTLNNGEVFGFVRGLGDSWLASTDAVTLGGDEWTRLRMTFRTTTETQVACGVRYTATSDGTGDTFYVDAIQLEEGSVASAWNPGQTGAVIVDVGGITIDGTKGATFQLRTVNGDVISLGDDGLIMNDEPISLLAHPVGSIYETTALATAAAVDAALGGTWEAFGAGRMTIGYDATDFPTVGATGGSKDHTHTYSTVIGHNHTLSSHVHAGAYHYHGGDSHYHTEYGATAAGGSTCLNRYGGRAGNGSTINTSAWGSANTGYNSAANTGGPSNNSASWEGDASGTTSSNNPPYIVVYRYRRTA